MIGSIEFISNRKVKKYQRIYLKIKDILPDIATLIGFINIIMKFITRFFAKKIIFQELVNYNIFKKYNSNKITNKKIIYLKQEFKENLTF